MGARPAPVAVLLGRGFLRRCPVCGQRGLFHRWFTIIERCPRCGLRFERIEGHWLGALGINTISPSWRCSWWWWSASC